MSDSHILIAYAATAAQNAVPAADFPLKKTN